MQDKDCVAAAAAAAAGNQNGLQGCCGNGLEFGRSESAAVTTIHGSSNGSKRSATVR
jgi:hypothetical protein